MCFSMNKYLYMTCITNVGGAGFKKLLTAITYEYSNLTVNTQEKYGELFQILLQKGNFTAKLSLLHKIPASFLDPFCFATRIQLSTSVPPPHSTIFFQLNNTNHFSNCIPTPSNCFSNFLFMFNWIPITFMDYRCIGEVLLIANGFFPHVSHVV